MDCKERILSEDYLDVITDYPVWRDVNNNGDYCYLQVDDQFYIVYFKRLGLNTYPDSLYRYQNIPKLYGLMDLDGELQALQSPGSDTLFDPVTLTAAGILQVQRPPLNLTGRGTVLCFIDTGERVIIMSGW